MTAMQTIGRLGIEGATPRLLEGLGDEHRRVRSAATLALERVGTDDGLDRLSELVSSMPGAERAIAKILARTMIL